MKKIFLLLSFILLLFFVGNGWCDPYTINSTNVGSVDIFIAAENLTVNEALEAAWAEDILVAEGLLDPTQNLAYSKTETIQYYQTNEDDNVFGFEITDTTISADYYILKNATKVALFQNVAEIDWAVFNITEIEIDGETVDMNLGELEDDGTYQISHVTILDDPDMPPPETPIPEPGTMMLLGFGLIGLAGIGRRKIKK